MATAMVMAAVVMDMVINTVEELKPGRKNGWGKGLDVSLSENGFRN